MERDNVSSYSGKFPIVKDPDDPAARGAPV